MIKEIQHPILQDKLTKLRQKETSSKEFRALVEEIAMLMTYEVARDFQMREIEIETPLTRCKSKILAEDKFVIVPILRAGLAMVNGVLKVFPEAAVGHIGLQRDETTHNPIEYYKKLPSLTGKKILVVDPMLATGGSSAAALQILKDNGATDIIFMCIISAPEGIKKILESHADIPIYTTAIDDHLNENCYIVPGLGDAGDRIFDTL